LRKVFVTNQRKPPAGSAFSGPASITGNHNHQFGQQAANVLKRRASRSKRVTFTCCVLTVGFITLFGTDIGFRAAKARQ
jgi:hypothetical protein